MEDSSCTQMESDSRSRVEVDIRTEETYMTYETYICESEDEGQINGSGIEAEAYGHGKANGHNGN